MVKVITHPVTGRTFKLGRRKPPQLPRRRLFLRNYLSNALPAPPASVSYSEKAAACLEQVLCNDTLGDCTAAGAFHIVGTVLGNAGTPVTWTDDEVIAFYSASTGYVPGKEATDQGGDEVTVLNYWRDYGLLADGSHKSAGHLVVDATNTTEVQAAIWLFENVYFGISLPDAWINPMPEGSGFTWDVAGPAIENNGHCFVGIGYDSIGPDVDTWGMLGKVTWDAVSAYCVNAKGGELHTVLSPDLIAKGAVKAPTGFDWNQLVADFDSMGGDLTAAA